MKTLLAILLATLCAATSYGQTMKALSYNSSNNTIVATQRVTFPLLGVASGTATTPSLTYVSGTNVFGTFAAAQFGFGPYLGFSVDGTRRFFISTNTIRAELPLSFANTTNEATTRTNLGLGATWLTNADVTNFRAAIGLGTNDQPVFGGATITGDLFAGNLEVAAGSDSATVTSEGIYFTGVAAATTRTNLGIPLQALTNTSNVTIMRALAGSTNTNQPFNGQFEFKNATDDVYRAIVSNGIILSVQEL
jgi:hypothetical protein